MADLKPFEVTAQLSTMDASTHTIHYVHALDEEDARKVFERVHPELVFVSARQM